MLPGVAVQCPYCGETITLLVDPLAGEQHYTEDCHVCCQPIVVHAATDAEGQPWAEVAREDDA
jgi:hypothetical protein